MSLPVQLIKTILVAASSQIYDNSDQLDIQIRFCYPNYDCHYTSAIAHHLSSKFKQSPQLIAQNLCLAISQISQLAIAANANSMINFTLTEPYIRECLKKIETSNLFLKFNPQPQNFPQYTYTQYAYARCCSLLRMTESEYTSVNINAELSSLTLDLALGLINIAETLDQLSSAQVIKHCQNLTIKFLEISDRSCSKEFFKQSLNILLLRTTKNLIYTLASGYISLPESL